eukprot:COSAG01_NODE_70687_length_258_cov_0.584906_1_plen_54_part_10
MSSRQAQWPGVQQAAAAHICRVCRLLPALRAQAVPQKPIQIGGRSWSAHLMMMM